MTYVIAFNFETFGPIPLVHGFARLNAVIGNLTTGTILDSFDNYANQSDFVSDSNYIDKWLQNPDYYDKVLEKCSLSDVCPYEVIEDFTNWVNKFIKQRNQSVYFIINSPIDIGILQTFSMCNNQLFNYRFVDLNSFFFGIMRLFMTEEFVDCDAFVSVCKLLKLSSFEVSEENDKAWIIFEKFKFVNDGLMD